MRKVRVADLAALAELDQQAYREESYGGMTLRQFCGIAGDLFQVAVQGGAIVGYGLALPTANAGEACFMSLVVASEFRGQGIGRALVEKVLANCDKRGLRVVWLTVDTANEAAIKLYSSFHFTTRNRVVAEYFGPERDRMVMRRKSDT